ncbi:hypothetical protein BMS3Abin15_00905 [bacterium BMS3Abin15]|nr:hypothetical protein BMS3Abin15_00905 [bacterium BMS3Abin15]HDH07756.1 class I SAM-dependent methyltransferase [Candidatus Moranbacteria bacterium]HDZ85448.1 class I SAM-dependent methyltransferase [Candidatus Moranbacteria bacterium]
MEDKIALTDKFINPDAIISKISISKDSIVADFGCGSGYFSIPIARAIEEGKLYSLDVLPQALESVESQAKIGGISNIVTKRVNLEKEKGSGLEEGSIDWVILKDMLFQNKNKEVVLKEAHRILKPGGKILVIEWGDRNLSVGPDKGIRISSEELEKFVEGQRFRIEEKVDAGDFHYGLIATKG